MQGTVGVLATVPFFMNNNAESFWGAVGGWIGSLFSNNPATPEQKVAYAQMSEGTLNAQFTGDKGLDDLIQGTISDCMAVRASERTVLKFIVTCFGSADNAIATQLQNMLDCPNSVQGRVDFLEMASQHYDANGTAWIMLVADDKGLPNEQWIMPSKYVAPRFSSVDDPVPIGYTWSDSRAMIAPEDLVIIRRNNIKTSPYKGRGVLLESELSVRLLDAIYNAQINFFKHGGAPNVVIEFPVGVDVNQAQQADYQARWNARYSGSDGSTNIAFIPDGGTVHNFGNIEVDYNESKDSIKADICQAFNTPMMMLGDVGDANFNNGQVAVAMFERTVVQRFGEKMADAYQTRFRANIHPSITVTIDPEVVKSFTVLNPMNGLKTENIDVVRNNNTNPIPQ